MESRVEVKYRFGSEKGFHFWFFLFLEGRAREMEIETTIRKWFMEFRRNLMTLLKNDPGHNRVNRKRLWV